MYTIVYETYLNIERQRQYGVDIVQEGTLGNFFNKAKEKLKKVVEFIKGAIIDYGRRLKFADRYYLSEQDYEILKLLYKFEDDLFMISKNLETYVPSSQDTTKIESFYEKASNAHGFLSHKLSEIKNKYSSKVDKNNKFAISQRELYSLRNELAKMNNSLVKIANNNHIFAASNQEKIYGVAVAELSKVCYLFAVECSNIPSRAKTGSLFTSHKNDKNPNIKANEMYLSMMITSTSDYIATENFFDMSKSYIEYKQEMRALNKKMRKLKKRTDPESIKERIDCLSKSTEIIKRIRSEINNMPEDKITVHLSKLLLGFLRFSLSLSGIMGFLIPWTNIPTNILRLISILGITLPPSIAVGIDIVKDAKNNSSERQSEIKRDMLTSIDNTIAINNYLSQTLRSELGVY